MAKPELAGVFARPFAHRGLHGPDVPENSMASFLDAVSNGYGIELDVQPAADGTPMVFHDEALMRLTGADGWIREQTPEALAALRLKGTAEGLPTLAEVLAQVAGRTPLLVEIKDQEGSLGPGADALALAVAEVLRDYAGPVAVMSFNPSLVAAFHAALPSIPCGLTTCAFDDDEWQPVPPARRKHLAAIADFDAVGAQFVSHDHHDLGNPALAPLRARGVPVLCWTIRSPAEAETALNAGACGITFQGFRP